MAAGVAEVLTYAVGVAISPVPIIAVILMLFSPRARINGPMFLLGWVVALVVVSGGAYLLADAGHAATDSTAADSVGWSHIVFGVLFLLLAARQWRNRPGEGVQPQVPKWMAGVDTFAPAKALGLGALLAGLNPKNLLLSVGAGTSLAAVGPSASEAAVSVTAFVVIGSTSVAAPVIYYLVGRDRAKTQLDAAKSWLGTHNSAVMTVLFLVFGVNLVAKGLVPLGS